jgi:hypothetical protein
VTRYGRGSEGGAETLEFLGVIPLLLMVAMLVWQGIVLVRQQAEADADARTLARQAVICDSRPMTLHDIDASAQGAAVHLAAPTPYVTVAVTLRPQSVIDKVDLGGWGFPSPRAVVTMRHEPC